MYRIRSINEIPMPFSSVILFSESNHIFVWYFNPTSIKSKNWKFYDFWGDLTDVPSETKALVLTPRLVMEVETHIQASHCLRTRHFVFKCFKEGFIQLSSLKLKVGYDTEYCLRANLLLNRRELIHGVKLPGSYRAAPSKKKRHPSHTWCCTSTSTRRSLSLTKPQGRHSQTWSMSYYQNVPGVGWLRARVGRL